ncbi:histidinol-phosphatase HisJ family protein [Paenibacillus sp. OV219]|uniref:histidinol-phosphatase HisJ family protein n=1 Tax=Paenibacillus sp. OV219 TaxID=1884377 RepID=UPI0008B9906D|nr:histidinol-phosphatase HisJ family protein [Paenibacillus sp. OV219]SEO52344.1 histidinol-phosphatase (PHP family) [Paenibacillus sp. OV219]
MNRSPAIVDQHVHTSYSPDSTEPLENIVRLAHSLGKSFVVTTDHFDYDCKYFKKDVLIDMPAYEREVDVLLSKYEIDIRKGIEVGYRRDYHNEINAYLQQYSFDLVLLSVHNNGVLDFAEDKFQGQPLDRVFTDYFMHVFHSVSDMDNYDVVAHLDYFVRYSKRVINESDYKRVNDILYDLLKVIIRKEKTLELNTTGLFRQGWIHPHSYLLRMYIDLGGKLFSLGSDAHRLEHYERGFEQAIELLKFYKIREIVQFKNRIPYTVSI